MRHEGGQGPASKVPFMLAAAKMRWRKSHGQTGSVPFLSAAWEKSPWRQKPGWPSAAATLSAAVLGRARWRQSIQTPSFLGSEVHYRRISWTMIMRLVRLIAPYRWQYGLVCLCGLLMAVLEMMPPRIVGAVVNRVTAGTYSFSAIVQAVLMWAAITVVAQVLNSYQIRMANRYGERLLSHLRLRLFSHLQSLSMDFFDKTLPGRIIACLANDVDALRGVLIWGLNTLVTNATIMVLATVMMAQTNLPLFLAVAWLAPVMTWLSFVYGRSVGQAWQKVRQYSSLVSANQAENIAGARVVSAFNRQETNLQRFDELQAINTANNIAASQMSGMFQPFLQGIRFLGQAIIVSYGGYGVAQGRIQLGDLVAVMLYWEWFMQPAVNFAALINDMMVAMAGAERIFDFLDQEPAMADPVGARDLPSLRGDVRFDHVSFAYQPGRTIVNDVSFHVSAGSTVALVGATGSGKSTIMSLLARFYQPQSGAIFFDDHDIRQASGASLHRQMAKVLQKNFLFQGTVLDNLRYACPEASTEEVMAAAKALGCHERFLRLKDGYHTMVGEKGSSLSLGERQLICFTRAMLVNPKILLLDEATSAMDSATERQLQKALQQLAIGRTTFIVAHRLSTIMNADLILVLDHGRIVEAGKHRELLMRRGKYASLHRAHARASLGDEMDVAMA